MSVAIHIRVYLQRDDGFVYEAQYDSNLASNFHTVTSLFQAKVGTSLAAVLLSQSPIQIRLFYQDPAYAIQEQMSDGTTWTQGSGLPSDDASPTTSLSATAWNGTTTEIRVYYQKSDATLGEIVFENSSWVLGANFTNLAFPATGIGAIILSNSSLPANPLLRVYYQRRDLSFHQLAYDAGNWTDQAINVSAAPPAPGAGIGAVEWAANDGSGESQINAFYEMETGAIVQASYESSSGWAASVVSIIVAGFRAPLAPTLWQNGTFGIGQHIRMYVQSSTVNSLVQINFDTGVGFTSVFAGF
jgi:hypothetical protein